MKIEAGAFYRTRDGRKAFVAARNPMPHKDRLWIGSIANYGAVSWCENGQWIAGVEGINDLIAPWTEPRKWTVWVYADSHDGYARGYGVEQTGASSTLVAKVEVTEGQGLTQGGGKDG